MRTALGSAPSEWACYRFTVKLRAQNPLLDEALCNVVAALRTESPDYGRDVAIDASDLPAYANGQRFLSKNGPARERYSEWGQRGDNQTRRARSRRQAPAPVGTR